MTAGLQRVALDYVAGRHSKAAVSCITGSLAAGSWKTGSDIDVIVIYPVYGAATVEQRRVSDLRLQLIVVGLPRLSENIQRARFGFDSIFVDMLATSSFLGGSIKLWEYLHADALNLYHAESRVISPVLVATHRAKAADLIGKIEKEDVFETAMSDAMMTINNLRDLILSASPHVPRGRRGLAFKEADPEAFNALHQAFLEGVRVRSWGAFCGVCRQLMESRGGLEWETPLEIPVMF
jgi:hypothetical protein